MNNIKNTRTLCTKAASVSSLSGSRIRQRGSAPAREYGEATTPSTTIVPASGGRYQVQGVAGNKKGDF
jgi:hypothetical protein